MSTRISDLGSFGSTAIYDRNAVPGGLGATKGTTTTVAKAGATSVTAKAPTVAKVAPGALRARMVVPRMKAKQSAQRGHGNTVIKETVRKSGVRGLGGLDGTGFGDLVLVVE